MANLGYIKSITGILKIASLLLLVITYGIGMHSYINSEYNKSKMDKDSDSTTTRSVTTTSPDEPVDKLPILWMERFLLVVTGGCFIISVIFLVIFLVRADAIHSSNIRGVDFGYHFAGAIFLIISAIFVAYSAGQIDSKAEEICSDPDNCQLMKEKLSASAFSFLTAIVFFTICIRCYGKKFFQTV